jgi:hypothetical protein
LAVFGVNPKNPPVTQENRWRTTTSSSRSDKEFYDYIGLRKNKQVQGNADQFA